MRLQGGGGGGSSTSAVKKRDTTETEQKAKVAKLESTPSNDGVTEAATDNNAPASPFPPFRVAVDYLFEKGKFAERKNKQRIDPRIFSPEMFRQVVFFLRDCLAFEAGSAGEDEETASKRGADEFDVSALKLQAPTIVKHMRQLLETDRSAQSPVKKYFEMVESLVRQDGSAECLYAWSELAAADDVADLGKEVADNVDWIRDKFLFSARDQVR